MRCWDNRRAPKRRTMAAESENTLRESLRTPLRRSSSQDLPSMHSGEFSDSSQNRDIEQLADKEIVRRSNPRCVHTERQRPRPPVATLGKGWVKLMRGKALLGALVGAVLVLATGCASSSSQEHKAQEHKAQEQKAYAPHIDPAEFTTTIDNEYFPLKPGTTFVYEGGQERDEFAVTHQTKKVMGVECVVVNDKAWENGKLIEQTYDWH